MIRRVTFIVAALGFVLSVAPLASGQAPTSSPASPAYGAAWNETDHPALAGFHDWAQRYSGAASASPDAGALAEGVNLAVQRRASLVELMHTDPAQAIAAAVPSEMRRKLPPQIVKHLEAPVSGVGDYMVYGAISATEGPAVEPISREVKLNGKSYKAFVYGRRLAQTTKQNIFLHGIAIDGEIVLHENALRILDPTEASEAAQLQVIDLSAAAPATARAADVSSASSMVEAGGKIYRFASTKELRRAESRLRVAEARIGPDLALPAETLLARDASDAESITSETPFTQGAKNVLVIRVDFSDLPGDPKYFNTTDTASYVQNIIDAQVKPFYLQSSYGVTSLTNTVATQLYRMPQTASYYAVNAYNDQLHTDARNAASANYAVASYDRITVVFSFLGNLPGSNIKYGGRAQLGAKHLWINGEFDFRVVSHELGHTYGMPHANLWQVRDGNPASLSGSSLEYGDDYDAMGANNANSLSADFNPWYKNRLDWLPASSIQTVTTTGTYRLSRFDGGSSTGIRALKIVKDSVRNYWIGLRRQFTSNSNMQHGLYIFWGYNTSDFNSYSNLLDMTTPGVGVADAGLATGTTFTDSAAQISITPLAEGGAAPNEYEDVQITFGATPPPPPPPPPGTSNDNLANAQVLSGASGTVTGNSSNATKETNEPSHAGDAGGKSIWYAWTPTTSGQVTFNTSGSGFDTLLAVYTGSGIASLNLIAQNDDDPTSSTSLQSVVSFNAQAGITYRIAVDGYEGVGGAVILNWRLSSVPLPTITSAATASGSVGVAFSYQITASNSPTSFGAVGLPAGLSVNTSTGLISGIPTVAGTVRASISATNGSGTSTAALDLTMAPAATISTITSALTANGVVNTAFSYQITASNTPIRFSASGLPSGISINTTTGLISGAPTTVGLYNVTLSATSATGGTGTAVLVMAIIPSGTSFFVTDAGQAVAQNIFFMGNTYDQVLMTGTSCMVGADVGQITRVSFIDLNDDIVFAEFGGAGALIITLDTTSGPAPAAKYNQPGVSYMKGRASFRIDGANATTYFSSFSLGTDLTRIDGRFLIAGAALDGVADVGLLNISGATSFGGVNVANALLSGTSGRVGIYAPGITFTKYLIVGDISASGTAIPTIDLTATPTVQIAGGDFLQPNGASIRYTGTFLYSPTSGITSTGVGMPAQTFRGVFVTDPSPGVP